jgi:excinuclease ABC subunit C
MKKFKYFKKEEANKLPKSPGVYSFSAKGGSAVGGKNSKEILYLGKAVNIRERVKNHFQQPGFKENIFLDKTEKIGFIKTNSEIEALILEANLIKKFRPKYNVIWRDDKNYFFVAKTKEDFPNIFITHQTRPISNYQFPITNYIGPFTDGKALKQTLKILRKVFPFKSCKRLGRRPCLWYQLDRCPAPCLLKSNLGEQIPSAQNKIKRESQNNAKNIFEILRGEKNRVLKELEKEMEKSSKAQEFEKASKIRDKIFSLKRIISHAKIIEEKMITEDWEKTKRELQKILKTEKRLSIIEAYDVSNIQGQEATGSMITFINGNPNKNLYRKFKIKISGKSNDVAMIKEVIKRRINHREWPYPDLILVDGGISQFNAAKSVVRNKNIPVVSIAKKENKLFVKGERQFFLKNLSRGIFNLILQLRDEAHRFALTYHLKLRKKRLVE